jgi:RHS repeat-associated protein
MVSVQPPNNSTFSFKYDPSGRRIQKSGASTTNYVYDGANVIEEVDQNGNLLAKYSQGAGIDEPLSELRSGAISYYEQDGIGSVTSLSGNGGALANTYAYDSFGNLTNSTGTVTNPYQYTGRDYDPETGLRDYRARYYDATTGRFISEDPLGFKAGIDFYSYVENSPTNGIDPFGLQALPKPAPGPAPGPTVINLEGPAILALLYYEAKLGAALFQTTQAINGANAADAAYLQAEHNLNQAMLANMQWWNDLVNSRDPNGDPLFDPYKKPGRCKAQNGCRPCDPPVGTISFQQASPNAVPHHPFGPNHWHLWEMHQAPASQGCFCFWVELGVGTGSAPSKAQPFPGPAGGGGPQ